MNRILAAPSTVGRVVRRYCRLPSVVTVALLLIGVGGVLGGAPRALAAAPPNDDYPGTAIASLPFSDTQVTTDATLQVGEPTTTCLFGSAMAKTVWYSYTPIADAIIVADTVGSDFDTVLAVWSLSEFPGGDLGEVACNDETVSSSQSRLSFSAEAGRAYYFQAGGFPFAPDTSGSLVFHVAEVGAAANDDMINATPISTLPFSDSVATFGATTEAGEPQTFCAPVLPVSSTVWYTLPAQADGFIEVDTSSSDFDTVLAVWAETPGGFSEVACNSDFGFDPRAKLAFPVNAGTNYFIQVGGIEQGFLPASGLLEITVSDYTFPACPPLNVTAGDQAGDATGTGTRHDIVGLAAGTDSQNLCVRMDFAGPIDVDDPDPKQDLFGYLLVDTDEKAATGIQGFMDNLCGRPANLGADVLLPFGAHYGSLLPVLAFPPPLPGNTPPPASVILAPTSVTFVIPLASLGGDNRVNFGSVIGSHLQPTDCIPDGGFVRSVLLAGDADCSGSVNSTDALKLLRRAIGLSVPQTQPCPDLGSGSPAFGDVDCNAGINSVDALKILRFATGLPVAPVTGCPVIGQPLSTVDFPATAGLFSTATSTRAGWADAGIRAAQIGRRRE
ncbi:MAG: hypothetical protein E6J42_03790 [Chloroflexi bacterium]|nr:MAG: hypothetical protein E6J42_03790 [Chloroflexota bacterium]